MRQLVHGFAIAVVVAVAPASASAEDLEATAAKSCSSGWTHAVINGVHKCLQAGQTCQHDADSQYHRYGFHCHRYDPIAEQYRLTEGAGSSPPPPPEQPPAEPTKPRAQVIDARVTSVVDGDTIRVRAFSAKKRFYTVRLI